VSALLEVGAGFHPELTGRENIRLNATILGFTNREIDRLMDAIIEFADIGDHIDAPIKHYSSGMYVRLGFAVAVMVRPEILLVDEVIAVGDEEFQRKCYDYLYDLRRAGTSMVIVSHGLGQITDLCDEAVWLDGGEVQMVGRPRRVVQGYLDSVNAKEAARTQVSDPVEDEEASTAPDAAASEAPRRLGSGEVRVTAVTVHNSQGAQVPFLVTGEQATFRIAYHATAEVQDGVFGLGFIHESGVFAAGPNSGRIGTWTLHPGDGHAEFSVAALPLQPGVFSVTAAIVARGHSYDYVERIAELRVRSTGGDEPGLVRMAGDWSISVRSAEPARAMG
jgi:ABC-2 type transport system ATP-binding protein/lipopolysaccharide transport system ATP-binding protein